MNTRTPAALLGLALAHLVLPSLGAAAATSTLVMPFDSTAGSVSFLAVNHRRPPGEADGAALRTHWAFWGDDCEPLLDVSLCLPGDGGVVVDPTAVPGAGPSGDLSGRRGFVTVTAYEAEGGCDAAPAASSALASGTLFGTFTLASLDHGAAFGGDAIAVPSDPTGFFADLPGGPGTHQSTLRLQSFAPARLDVSRIVLLALRERRGIGSHRATELGPAGSGSDPIRAAARFIDNAGFEVPLPEIRFGCVLFASLRADDPDALLTPELTAGRSASGVLEIEAPRTGGEPLGRTSWLYGFHGQALGTFGVLAVAHSEGAAARALTPLATATPRPSAQATRTSAPTPTVGPTPLGPPTLAPSPAASGNTATPAATRTSAPTPTVGPTPLGPPTLAPSPAASGNTATPAATPTPDAPAPSGASPAPPGITSTPSPGVTPTHTPPPAPTPTRPPAPTAPACTSLTVEIRSSYGPGGSNVAGVVATLGYPPASVAIPGTANAASVAARVTNVSGANGLFQVVDRDTNGDDVDDTLRIGLVSVLTAIPAGPLARVRFDCTSGATPPATAFGCALEASTLEGTLLPGVTCTVEILP